LTLVRNNSAEIAMTDPAETTETADAAEAGTPDAAKRLREAALIGAVSRNPSHVAALIELADFFISDDRDREASLVFNDALAVDPENTEALLKLGTLLHQYPAFYDEAIQHLQKAISIDPALAAAYRPLASTLNDLGRHDEALAVLRAWRETVPNDPAAKHFLAAYSGENLPERMSDACVQQHFDTYADRFDAALRDTLQYRAPEVLVQHLTPLLPPDAAGSLTIVDAGCGTGLAAPLLRPLARRLVGVDLSPKMLEKARAGGLYDVLETAEVTAWFGRAAPRAADVDLAFLADTVIYFGRLEALLASVFAALKPGGWLAFTTEKIADGQQGDFTLSTSGRYQHSGPYLNEALTKAGFGSVQMTEAQIRLQLDEPEVAFVVAAKKPG
jgi:predicted TPR repeat methyltransferase